MLRLGCRQPLQQCCKAPTNCQPATCLVAARGLVTIPFEELRSRISIDKGWQTRDAYAGCQLATLSPQSRGHVLERAVRSIYAQLQPGCVISDPTPGQRCDGRRRSLHQAEYDWMCDARRVECKTGQLCWSEKHSVWTVSFHNIKFELLDELLLIMYTPFRIHLLLHDHKSGVSCTGSRAASRGVRVKYSSPKHVRSCAAATQAILEQFACQLVASEPTSHEAVQQAYGHYGRSMAAQKASAAFRDHPLGGMTPTARGMYIEQLVWEVDRMLYPSSHFRSQLHTARQDWFRDNLRVECKHGRLYLSAGRWTCRFSAIKFQSFDSLYLAIDSPAGIFILQHAGDKFRSTSGVETAHMGENIAVRAPKRVVDCHEAAQIVVDKLVQTGSKHLATIHFHGSGISQLPTGNMPV